MASSKIFSIEGKGLKLDTAADLEPHVTSLRDNANVEEVRLAGNTLGVEACSSLAKILGTKKTLQVSEGFNAFWSESWVIADFGLLRSQTSRTYSLPGFLLKSPPRSTRFLRLF